MSVDIYKRPAGCLCTWEEGDSACPVHPTCFACGCVVCECKPPAAVAIGDTFHKAGDPDGAWEVTREGLTAWRLERGPLVMYATTRQLLDASLWTRARAL